MVLVASGQQTHQGHTHPDLITASGCRFFHQCHQHIPVEAHHHHLRHLHCHILLLLSLLVDHPSVCPLSS